ncbi:hypothetical protein [Legionella shakespearei]|uniref:Uncharacterized protein n=1 Tax=Legionella shakespearei DSM 23087 TaxID=1122169 RepID=A0A0W0Z8R6_9GAMM|nr:hypothetical protein [Legionella shakespearei]KTD65449.1 hypothetical protein Lsha_0266 [Legionella shakespearei DSM 23087]
MFDKLSAMLNEHDKIYIIASGNLSPEQKDTDFVRGKAVRMALALLNPSPLTALNMHCELAADRKEEIPAASRPGYAEH